MLQHGAKVKMPDGTVARVIRQTGERVQLQYPGKGGVMQSAIVLAHGLEVLDARADSTFLKNGPGEQPEEDRQVADGETAPADASSHVLTEIELAMPKPLAVDDRPVNDLTGETAPASCVDPDAAPAAPAAATETAPDATAPDATAPDATAPDATPAAPEGSTS